jgi:hypothetical protein
VSPGRQSAARRIDPHIGRIYPLRYDALGLSAARRIQDALTVADVTIAVLDSLGSFFDQRSCCLGASRGSSGMPRAPFLLLNAAFYRREAEHTHGDNDNYAEAKLCVVRPCALAAESFVGATGASGRI